ncbi:S9 family peptidase [Dyadobacter sp. CY323]|uniref:alpha/beta hydrolase family protein n=1 Tax=Dyadobacter sp. CY323 TaxID=2907302 RepID=UPI001F3D4CAC|nr:acetylxylan esterase [Dyadobacter sp. CY323]MCE6991826.1 acetylxylan esterase [Dyadobacter sp. CY323]
MKNIFFLVLITFTAFGQQKTSLVINREAIKIDSLLWDLGQLSKAPEVEWLDKKSPVHTLLYKSVAYDGHPTQVFAYYSNPNLLNGITNRKNKFPGIVLIHGGGGKAFKEWVEKWASEGYAAIAMDLSGNGADGKKLAQPGPDQSQEQKFDKMGKSNPKDMWSYHAVAASIQAHSLLLNFPEVDQAKTGVTGISWGGYLTCIVASLDNRFKAAVPVYGCGYYDESDVFKVPLNHLSEDVRHKWMRYFDPSVYLPFASPQFCFVNGNKDKFYNVVTYSKTYNLVAKNKRQVLLLPEMKHSHEWGWEPHEIRYFMENILENKAPLTMVTDMPKGTDEVKASYQGPVSLWYADFYYSNDTTSTNEERVWLKKKVKIDPETRTLSTDMRTENFKYGFFYTKDHRNISASSEFIFN